MRARHAVLLACLLASTARAQALPPDLDAYVEAVRAEFHVPGLALTVTVEGKTGLARGYGVQRLGEDAAVAAGTLFGIASNTKVFTGAALLLLQEDGKLRLDDRVQDHLPWFHLSDPYISRELTLRDLLVHRSGLGLGAGDLLWWPGSSLDRRTIAERLRHVPIATSFRSTYAYDNVLYLVAGEVIAQVSGQSWEQFVQQRLLRAACMPHATARYDDAAGRAAGTHAEVDGTVRALTPMRTDNTNPAGGIMASAVDMAQWMHVLLHGGMTADDRRVLAEASVRELMTLVTPMPVPVRNAVLQDLAPQFEGYGLGLDIRDYRGHKVCTHTGGLPGYVSRVFMIPKLGLGISVLTNQESMHAIDAIVYHIVDHCLGKGGQRDWLQTFRAAEQRARADVAADRARQGEQRAKDTTPSLPLAGYAATYHDAWCGEVVVTERDSALHMQFADTALLSGPLEHWHHDTFVVRWSARELRADAFVTFVLGADGKVAEARLEKASPEVDFSFDFEHLRLVPKR